MFELSGFYYITRLNSSQATVSRRDMWPWGELLWAQGFLFLEHVWVALELCERAHLRALSFLPKWGILNLWGTLLSGRAQYNGPVLGATPAGYTRFQPWLI